jgi:hypothetical protein
MGLANIIVSLRVQVDHVVESYDHFHIHVFIRILMHANILKLSRATYLTVDLQLSTCKKIVL